jgi:hypothetical protein
MRQVPAPNHTAKGTLTLARKGVTAKFTDEPAAVHHTRHDTHTTRKA